MCMAWCVRSTDLGREREREGERERGGGREEGEVRCCSGYSSYMEVEYFGCVLPQSLSLRHTLSLSSSCCAPLISLLISRFFFSFASSAYIKRGGLATSAGLVL